MISRKDAKKITDMSIVHTIKALDVSDEISKIEKTIKRCAGKGLSSCRYFAKNVGVADAIYTEIEKAGYLTQQQGTLIIIGW